MPIDAAVTSSGALPVGIHRATFDEVIQRFGSSTPRRALMGDRLRRVYEVAAHTGHLSRFIVFGSFVSRSTAPNDVDVFLVMDDEFDAAEPSGEGQLVFDHPAAQIAFGASVFWMSQAAVDVIGEELAVEHWQMKRDGTRRGIVEVVADDQD